MEGAGILRQADAAIFRRDCCGEATESEQKHGGGFRDDGASLRGHGYYVAMFIKLKAAVEATAGVPGALTADRRDVVGIHLHFGIERKRSPTHNVGAGIQGDALIRKNISDERRRGPERRGTADLPEHAIIQTWMNQRHR